MNDVLKGEKIYLKPVEKCELQKRAEWVNDPEVQATLNFVHYPVSLARMEKWFDNILYDLSRRDFSVYTIKRNEYIGFCGFINIDNLVMKAELYVTIGKKEYWNGGYGTDTYKTIMKYGFIELGLNKIYGYQLEKNIGAHKVVQKLGWQRDGLLRHDIFSHGKIKNRYVVSILREDWLEIINKGNAKL